MFLEFIWLRCFNVGVQHELFPVSSRDTWPITVLLTTPLQWTTLELPFISLHLLQMRTIPSSTTLLSSLSLPLSFLGQLVSQDCYEPGTTVHTSNLILRTGRWCTQGQSGLHSKGLFHKQQQENIKLLCWDFHRSLCLTDLFLLSWAVLIWFSLVFRGKMGQVLFPKHA